MPSTAPPSYLQGDALSPRLGPYGPQDPEKARKLTQILRASAAGGPLAIAEAGSPG
jgi:hypothetical protein